MSILRVCDLETTGMEPPAEVCEAAFCDMVGGGDFPWLVGNAASWLCIVRDMPAEVRAIHHITMDDVRDCQPFESEAMFGADLTAIVAHNADFERRFIDAGTVPWICTYKAALRVWPEAPSHSNSVLRYWLEDQGLLSLDHDRAMPPHRAGPDAYVTAHILKALLKLATVEEMVEWTKQPRVLPRCTIGKFKGKPWAEVEIGFLNWMLQQASMESDLKWNARREIERRRKGMEK